MQIASPRYPLPPRWPWSAWLCKLESGNHSNHMIRRMRSTLNYTIQDGGCPVWIRWEGHYILLFSAVFLWFDSSSNNILFMDIHKTTRYVKINKFFLLLYFIAFPQRSFGQTKSLVHNCTDLFIPLLFTNRERKRYKKAVLLSALC